MRVKTLAAAAAMMVFAAACEPGGGAEGPAPSQASAAQADAIESACPDDGPRLAETRLCQRSAAAMIEHAEGAGEIEYGDGCTSVMNETLMAGDEALIYGAAKCGDVVTTLDFAGGAHSASINYVRSAFGGDAVKGAEVIRVFGTDPDPQGALKEVLAGLPEAERADCEIRPAGMDGWPADALVIAPTAAARAKHPADEPVALCGPWGFDEDATSFWRITQGYAWFFQLGQDMPDFDAASVTLIRKQADGSWMRVD
ncbi:hypothetical protein GC169_03725 [bacterium]|nr:hypothetical protein [bacterium]